MLKDRFNLILDELKINDIGVGDSLNSGEKISIIKSDVTNPKFIDEFCHWLDEKWEEYKRINTLLFVDPDSPRNLHMNTLKQLLHYPGDLLMLIHSGTFVEWLQKDVYANKTLKDMMGITDDGVSELKSYPTLAEKEEFYIKCLADAVTGTTMRNISDGHNTRKIIFNVKLKTANRTYYNLLLAVRRTQGGESESWQSGFEIFADKISKLSETGKHALEVIEERQTTMDVFGGDCACT